jgi:Cof subfamily protein (haloacid dehalogenase superfamily)
MSIKLIALDVDGTLMSSRNELLPSTVEALQAAADRGIHIVLCTGRMLSECGELLEQLPMIRYAVTCTGAQTVDTKTGATIGRRSLTADDLRLLCSHFWDLDVLLQVFDDHDGLMHNDAKCLAEAERFCSPGLAQAIRRYHAPEADLRAYVDAYEGPTNKLHMFFASAAHKNLAVERTKGLPYDFADTSATDLEIMPLGVDKGLGLQQLADYLDLDRSRVMAIGDGGNDEGMLRFAGLAVAMGNANDYIKSLAHRVTADNDHDGVAKAVWQVLKEI